jgi:hypothetical protein
MARCVLPACGYSGQLAVSRERFKPLGVERMRTMPMSVNPRTHQSRSISPG